MKKKEEKDWGWNGQRMRKARTHAVLQILKKQLEREEGMTCARE